MKSKVKIICKDHGIFEQRPDSHKNGLNCYKCGKIKQSNTMSRKVLEQKININNQPLDYKLIAITKGKFVKVDNDDFDKISSYNWNYHYGYCKNHKLGLMHRFIMKCFDDNVVDHINHDTLDNRKSNLRICTKQENNFNRNAINTSKSRYKGVMFNKENNNWRSVLSFNGKKIHLGYFDNEIDGAKAYDKKAKELFGEFAYLNFNDNYGSI